MCSLSLKNQFSIKKKSLLMRCFFNNFWSRCCLPTYQFSINRKSLLLCPKFVVRDNMFNDDMFSLSFKHLMNIIWNNFWSCCCLPTYQFIIKNQFSNFWSGCCLPTYQFSIKKKLLLLCPKFVVWNSMFIDDVCNNFWSGCCLPTYHFSIK